MLGFSRTPPFRSFQKSAGFASLHINTMIVGLELVARGGQKPESLNIKWTPPNKPRELVEQTKHFALLAFMTQTVDAFDELLRSYGRLDWVCLSDRLRPILRKAEKKAGNVDWSIPDRTDELLKGINLDMRESLAFLGLLVAWRNSKVHAKATRAKAKEIRYQNDLVSNKEEIAQKYAGIDIEKTLENFESGKFPTLKEATTLIAVAQNLSRSIDSTLLKLSAGTEDQIRSIAESEVIRFLKKPDLNWKQIWGYDTDKRGRILLNILADAGITDSQNSISATLPSNFLIDFASLPKTAIAEMLSGRSHD